MSEEDNRSFDNLVLLCLPHATEIDGPAAEARFPPTTLREWKREQLRLAEVLQQRWELSDEEIREAHVRIEVSDGSTLQLGGEGGQAPGAGGGGGGAIGAGARGGRGGPGGRTFIYVSPGESPERALRRHLQMEALGGDAFGAGGGGEGATGPGARGGDGGAGGDSVSAETWIPRGEHPIRVGRAGGLGAPAEYTVLNIQDEDGELLEQIVTRNPTADYVPMPEAVGRPLAEEDIEGGLSVRSMTLSHGLLSRRGMVDLLTTNWTWLRYETAPFADTWFLTVFVATGTLAPGDPVVLDARVVDATGFCVIREQFDVEVADGGTESWHVYVVRLHFTGADHGTWKAQVYGAKRILGEFEVLVTCPELPDESEAPVEGA